VGLVAGKLAEHYKKPVFVLAKEAEEATGSARTSGSFDVVMSLKATEQYLVKFGGHKQAAGLTVRTAQLEQFYQELLKFAEQNIAEEEQEPVLELEAELRESDFSMAAYDELEKLEPYGVGNSKPKFLISAAQLVNHKLVGATQQHVQIQLIVGSAVIDCIAFSMPYIVTAMPAGSIVDVAAELIADSWNGTKKLKLKIVDIKLTNQ
jgi:single-stranded-DNA-specific exonuclease